MRRAPWGGGWVKRLESEVQGVKLMARSVSADAGFAHFIQMRQLSWKLGIRVLGASIEQDSSWRLIA